MSIHHCNIVATGLWRDVSGLWAETFFWLVTQKVMHFNLTTLSELTGLFLSKSNKNAPKLNSVKRFFKWITWVNFSAHWKELSSLKSTARDHVSIQCNYLGLESPSFLLIRCTHAQTFSKRASRTIETPRRGEQLKTTAWPVKFSENFTTH